MNAPADFALDRALVRRRFGAAAARYAGNAVLARELARRMDERLEYIRFTPARIVDLGCGIGEDLALLGARYPQAERIGIDFAAPMLAEARRRERAGQGLLGRLLGRAPATPLLCADACALPLAHASVSMVWSNLMLNWLADPLPALKEMHRVLEVGGMAMFSTLGPDTLRELREALPAGAGERVHCFIDMHDIGDTLVRAGFADPVMDMEMLTLTYADFDDLLADLRLPGCANASTTRPRGLSGRNGWAQARAAYEELRREGRLPATFEIIQGHAWKAEPKTTEDGRAIVRFAARPGAGR
ncbi:methyltransferase domain-containing protein [Pseudothauera nasutitermitis]|uniref:Malonyl-[acyl-carrier protein] O-methyltransferase n=1 Tax=Pseudothauera nasutitermitis TaxID=2565930 RepID=A0A4S4ARB2_9RHOO|nr:methyltransferase domain-containing protein [Pseudothauera nasutitermitis]THF62351.1 methyltransferase domain-containing protein [Pseudothauera nasutitermitis]